MWQKVKEEISEFEAEVPDMDKEKATAEFGDVMFSLINAARLYGINPDNALERTNQKFIRRFNYLESKTLKQGRDLKDMTLAEMDAIWDEAKKREHALRVEHDYSLLHHNTFGLDVQCRRFIEYHDEQQLCEALNIVRETPEEPFLQIGGGSNLLFTRDFPGTVLKSAIHGLALIPGAPSADTQLVRAGAAESWDAFVEWTLRRGLSGLECLSLIPGEVGAAAVQNIGAYGSEACQHIHAVHTIAVATGQPRVFTPEECRYAYRSSIFKHELAGQYIITHVDFCLNLNYVPAYTHRAIPEGLPTAQAVREAVIEIRQAKLPDPAVLGSAGSFFMNPVVAADVADTLLASHPDMPHYSAPLGVKIPAAWLIEQAGWKGRGLSDDAKARTYDKQALVIVNHGGARPKDIVKLAAAIQESVQEKFGIALQPEAIYV